MRMNAKGFTLVELVIVIIVVTVLSIVAVPIYRTHLQKATITEGKTLLKTVDMAERLYYNSGNNEYVQVSPATNKNADLDTDCSSNKYFLSFEVHVSGDSFTATTTGTSTASGIVLTLISPSRTASSYFEESGISD